MTLLILTLVFAACFAAVFSLGTWTLARRPLERRLGRRFPEAADGVELRREPIHADDANAADIRGRLAAAGYDSAGASAGFRTLRLAAVAGLAVATFVGLALLAPSILPPQRLVMALAAGGFGWLVPPMVLDRLAARRRDLLRVGFPDSLDLMQVCVEAGLGLDAAFAQVAEELGAAHPALGAQYRQLGQELRAGRSRDDALRGLADRLGLDEAKAFATMMIQSDALGTSVSDALRTYAEDMRGRRMLAAEEKAQQLGVKLSLPLVGLILPALMVVIVTPAAQKLARLMWPLIESVK